MFGFFFDKIAKANKIHTWLTRLNMLGVTVKDGNIGATLERHFECPANRVEFVALDPQNKASVLAVAKFQAEFDARSNAFIQAMSAQSQTPSKSTPHDVQSSQSVPQSTAQTVDAPKFYPVQPTKPVAEKLTWKFEGKTLTVGGVRVIENFPYAQIPWIDHLRKTQKIVITDGVEEIAAHAFSECTSLELIELPASLKTIGDMAFSCSYCGERFVNGGKNVFWSLEDGVLVLKKNPDAPPAADFFTGSVSWIFAEKNIRSVKFEDGVKPTEKFFSWLAQRFDGKEISFK